MTVTVKHSKTNSITDWTQAQLDEQIELGNFPAGTTLANIVLPSDWNNDHTLTGVGTMAEQNANSVAITGGTINNTTIGATTASTGVFTTLTSTGQTFLGGVSGSDVVRVYKDNTIAGTTASFTAPALSFIPPQSGFGASILRSSTQLNITTGSTTPIVLQTASTLGFAGTEQARVSHTASAVNYVQVTGAATGQRPTISAQGSDSNINLYFQAKGSGQIQTAGWMQVGIGATNYWQLASASTGTAPILSSTGGDTNISMAFQPKGTGAIDLAAGSSGVNISNGGTVTAITRTAAGSAYTSKPSVAITAPTTAGGVTALASVAQMQIAAATIASGGTGYTVGDVLTIVGGTPVTTGATLTVSTVSAGVITAVTVSAFNNYTVLPTNPVSVTGGTGSGATFNITYAVISFTIDNAGSGYIEQPTVSFSGGGGSGAAAYATVGSGTTFRTIGSTMSFYTPNGETIRVSDNNATAVNYWAFSAGTATANPLISVAGSGTNVSQTFNTKGTGVYQFNTGSALQYQIAHTASAVNYVQVTGNVTTGPVTISSQGSDANVSAQITTKGTGSLSVFSNNGSNRQFRVDGTTSSVNYLDVWGSIAGSAPSLRVAGTDTNIDLALTPKGTGVVRFGTYTANMALTVQGYIEIKDSGGTLRKLAVIA